MYVTTALPRGCAALRLSRSGFIYLCFLQVFVANPNKEPSIHDILYKNQDKLKTFLETFHEDRTDDDQFNEEKAYLIKQVRNCTKFKRVHVPKVYPRPIRLY